MRRPLLASVTLALALTGCGLAPTAVGPAGQTAFSEIESLGRKALGGAAYQSFRIAPELPVTKGARKAVKLTYLMNDDTAHQSPWSEKMLAMLQGLPQKDVHNLVFRDGKAHGDSKLYYLTGKPTEGSPLAPGVTEVQSNNPKVFSQVLAAAFGGDYQGSKRYLQVYTHGGGVFGMGTDENQTDLKGNKLPADQQIRVMALPELSEALRQGLKGRQLDALYFRACLMGNVEALYELRGTTRYAIASEEVSYSVDNSNLTMTKLFEDLAAQGAEPAALAKQMAIAGLGKQGPRTGYATMAAVDIGKMDELKSAINTLAKALVASLPTEGAAIKAAYDAVPHALQMKQMRDLWAFTAQLDQKVKDAGVKAAVRQVRDAQEAAMLHSKDAYGSGANGLSILMPARTELGKYGTFIKGEYQRVRFAKDTGWDDLLTALGK